jgi:hypothetical protein
MIHYFLGDAGKANSTHTEGQSEPLAKEKNAHPPALLRRQRRRQDSCPAVCTLPPPFGVSLWLDCTAERQCQPSLGITEIR